MGGNPLTSPMALSCVPAMLGGAVMRMLPVSTTKLAALAAAEQASTPTTRAAATAAVVLPRGIPGAPICVPERPTA